MVKLCNIFEDIVKHNSHILSLYTYNREYNIVRLVRKHHILAILSTPHYINLNG